MKNSLLTTNILSCIGATSLLLLSKTTNIFESSLIMNNIAIPITFACSGTSFFYYHILSIHNAKWIKMFKSIGLITKEELTPTLYKTVNDEHCKKYYFTLPDGVSHNDFVKLKDKIESSLRHPISLSYTREYHTIISLSDLNYQEFYKPEFKIKTDYNLLIPIGVSISNDKEEIIKIDMNDEPHVLVAGINGSGKTTCILSILTHLCIKNVELKIINLKANGDYFPFKNYKYTTSYISTLNDTKTEIESLIETMKSRNKLLEKANCRSFTDYNKKYKHNQMKPIVVVMEEFVMLSDLKKDFTSMLNQLLSMSRSTNIKFIITVQRPCSDNIKSTLKANLNHSIVFKCKTSSNSEVALDKGDYRAVTELHDKGEGILFDLYNDTLFKSYFVYENDILTILKENNLYITTSKTQSVKSNTEPIKAKENINKGVGLID